MATAKRYFSMHELEPASRLTPSDTAQVIRLFQSMRRQHLHLDWHTLDDWLNNTSLICWVTRQEGRIKALLGATLDATARRSGGPMGAWLRLAIPARPFGVERALDSLWPPLLHDLQQAGVSILGLLVIEPWMEDFARRWGFERVNGVVTMRRDMARLPAPPDGAPMPRIASVEEVNRIVELDRQAFAPLWRYDHETLRIAVRHANTLTVIEQDGNLLAYQLSARYGTTGHLARLAVLPEQQGLGLGRRLVHSMLEFFERQGIRIVTVNTQADNYHSQRLYGAYGFKITGHEVPVWTQDVL